MNDTSTIATGLPRTNSELAAFIESGGRNLSRDEAVAFAYELLTARSACVDSSDLTLAPDVIYHYCPVEAFEGILQSGQVRLSDSKYTNDKEEVDYAFDLIASVMKDQLEENEARSQLNMLKDSRPDPHIACFSRKRDSLSQWRAYAGNGSGLAIGFGVRRLGLAYNQPCLHWDVRAEENCVTLTRQTCIVPIIYDLGLQRETIRIACERYKHATASLRRDDLERRRQPWTMLLLGLHSLSLMMKNPGFVEEAECRIVDGENLMIRKEGSERLTKKQMRLASDGERWFVPFSFRKDGVESPIVEVTLGPRNKIADEAMQRFLEQYGVKNVKLSRSAVSYQ